MDFAVMARAQHDQVVEFGAATVGPFPNVVDVAPGRWPVASWVRAAAIAGGDRAADVRWDAALGATHIQWFPGAVEDDRGDRGVAADLPQRRRGEVPAEVQAGGAGAALQVIELHG